MLLTFPALADPVVREKQARLRSELRRVRASLFEGSKKERQLALSSLCPGISFFESAQGEVELVSDELVKEELLRFIAALAPGDGPTHRVGRSARSHQQALSSAKKETGVDLTTSRVRAGFSRGHLLEVVFMVPLDVAGDDESLQIASEVYLEESLGDEISNTWVANVSVSRIRRTRGLVTLADSASDSENHPLEQLSEMVSRAVRAVQQELPPSLLSKEGESLEWTALEMPPSDSGLQAARIYASTRFPEALKSVLEGLPFSSRRFTQGQEIFAWISWCPAGLSLEERLSLRARVEELVSERFPEMLLAGNGFSRDEDYVDLWLMPSEIQLRSLLESLAALVSQLELGFYDSHLRAEVISWP